VAVPDCQAGEDVVFSDDNKTWYLSCMGNQTVVIGDATSDKPTKSVKVGVPYPHGVAVSPSIDRMLTTGTVRASDGGDAGEMISEVQISTGKVVNSYKVSNKPSPSGAAPVEILFVPGVSPPMAYVTNLYGGTLWLMRWNTDKKAFDVSQAHDFAGENSGVPLEMYFSKNLDRMYVTTGKPGSMHIFDTSGGNITSPKLIKTIAAAEGSHHVAFTKDGRYAYVQNALLNLPGLSDGSVTVVDLKEGKQVASMDTLKLKGLNANCVVLLPKWNDPKGH
jgi:DNA-binding beta-propeller fold protein YncE